MNIQLVEEGTTNSAENYLLDLAVIEGALSFEKILKNE